MCRPLTTGAIFVSQRCSLKPFKNGKGAGKKERERERQRIKAQSPSLRGPCRHIRKSGGLLAPDPPGEFERAERITRFSSEFFYNSRRTLSYGKDIVAGFPLHLSFFIITLSGIRRKGLHNNP